MSNVFHKIIDGELPCYKVAESEGYLAFLDIFAKFEGQTVVIPKRKDLVYVWDMPQVEAGELMEFSHRIASHYRGIDGVEMVYSYISGNQTPHPHINLVPAKKGQFITEVFDFDFVKPTDSDILEASQAKYTLDDSFVGSGAVDSGVVAGGSTH